MNIPDPILISSVKCPFCGNAEKVLMPRYASKTYYECPSCKTVFQSNKGDCCIFCSLGDTSCPPSQEKNFEA